jgi:predicted GNAT family acetyltransferase
MAISPAPGSAADSPAPGRAAEPAHEADVPVVTDNAAQSRFEIHVGGERAGLVQYDLHEDTLTLIHTEVGDKFQGLGLASKLARSVLDSARERGLAVLPYCPYIAGWIRKHPDYRDLVPQDRRERFGL